MNCKGDHPADRFPDGSFLVFLSGGPDSTAAAFDMLKQGHSVLGVHIEYAPGVYNDSTPLHYYALDNVTCWLQAEFPGRFEVCKTHYPLDSDALARMVESEEQDTRMYQHWGDTCRLIAKALMLACPKVTKISYTPPHVDEIEDMYDTEREDIYDWLADFDTVLPSFVHPSLTKKDTRKSMPTELWDLTISCWKTTPHGPCGKCKKCIERAKAYA